MPEKLYRRHVLPELPRKTREGRTGNVRLFRRARHRPLSRVRLAEQRSRQRGSPRLQQPITREKAARTACAAFSVFPAFLSGAQFRGELAARAFGFIRLPAVVRLPPEQAINHTSRPCAHAVLFPAPCPAAHCLVGPAGEERVDELIRRNEHGFEIRHRARPSGSA